MKDEAARPQPRHARRRRSSWEGRRSDTLFTWMSVGVMILAVGLVIGVVASSLTNDNASTCTALAEQLYAASEAQASNADDVIRWTANADYSELTDTLIFQAPADDVKALDKAYTADGRALDAIRGEWDASTCGVS